MKSKLQDNRSAGNKYVVVEKKTCNYDGEDSNINNIQ